MLSMTLNSVRINFFLLSKTEFLLLKGNQVGDKKVIFCSSVKYVDRLERNLKNINKRAFSLEDEVIKQ